MNAEAMPTPTVSRAYYQGYNQKGRKCRNPYNYYGREQYDTPESEAWVKGWHDGAEEAKAWETFGNAAGM